jgi:hypothetical protein
MRCTLAEGSYHFVRSFYEFASGVNVSLILGGFVKPERRASSGS